MNRLDRLKKAIEYLTNNGYIHFQTDIAKRMDSHPQPVSKACKGDERYLTDKFLVRFNTAFGNIFNIDWLQNGNGEMLSPDPKPQSVVNSQNTVQNNSSLSFGNTDIEKELIEQLKRKDEQINEQAQQIKILLQMLGERK
jgi:hypothetical protein